MIQVLLVDDSAAIRGILRKAVDGESDMHVCGAVSDGQQAVQVYGELRPDIVIMDVEMPVLDGIGALRQILESDPYARIIMCSSITEAGGDTTLEALRIGAIDYLLKPTSNTIFTAPDQFQQALLEKIRTGARKPGRGRGADHSPKAETPAATLSASKKNGTLYTLRAAPPSFHKADMIAIGSSTGGVQAIFDVLEGLGTTMPGVPIMITQHMPASFTRILANHIRQKTGMQSYEAEQGMRVEKNHVYIAPGGYHMEVEKKDKDLNIVLTQSPPENFCRPSVDPMMRSLLRANIPHILTVILTGMGNDGLSGARMAVEAGHMLIAQDEASSVVWGMPGAVATAGLCHAVLPLDQIGKYITRYI